MEPVTVSEIAQLLPTKGWIEWEYLRPSTGEMFAYGYDLATASWYEYIGGNLRVSCKGGMFSGPVTMKLLDRLGDARPDHPVISQHALPHVLLRSLLSVPDLQLQRQSDGTITATGTMTLTGRTGQVKMFLESDGRVREVVNGCDNTKYILRYTDLAPATHPIAISTIDSAHAPIPIQISRVSVLPDGLTRLLDPRELQERFRRFAKLESESKYAVSRALTGSVVSSTDSKAQLNSPGVSSLPYVLTGIAILVVALLASRKGRS